jgi:hypothetical protein
MDRLKGVPALLLALVAPWSNAGEVRAHFRVTATVTERAHLEVLEEPATVTVTDADLQRGYAEATAQYEVRQNLARGYLLRLSPRLGFDAPVRVTGLGSAVELGASGVEVHRVGDPPLHRLFLAYRFSVDPAIVRPGTYRWPVHVEAVPL